MTRESRFRTHCDQCGKPLPKDPVPIRTTNSWCDDACADAWYSTRPDEAAKWIRVEDLTPTQMATLKADLGLGEKC